jgi:RNA polymerase sigma-70 factor (sigma-E family)
VGRDPTVERDFREFVASRSGALQRTAYLLTGDWSLAEDLVQTTLMKTYLAWQRAGGIDTVEAYARRVMVNTATSWWRRRWRGERPTEQLPEIAYGDGADQLLERDAVWQLICGLPAGQRAVVVLRYYEDLTEAQTAELLGVSVGTVKRQAARAMDALRQRLSPPSASIMQGGQR